MMSRAPVASPSLGWTPSTPFPPLPTLTHAPSPFPASPSPPASAPSSITTPGASSPPPMTLSPLVDFYTSAREWTAAARLSLEPSPPPTPPVAYSKKPRPRRPRPAVIVKSEPEEVSLHSLPVVGLGIPGLGAPLPAGTEDCEPAVPQAGDPELQRLLGDYERMLWERVESCKRIERLIEDSARLLAGS